MEGTAESAMKFLKELKKASSMNDEDFPKLVLSVKQMGTIMQGGKIAHRRTTLTDLNVKELRERTGLTQTDFSQMIGVSIRTLQNWEQGRREPEGPAKAWLRVVERNPQAVLSALHE
jgi:putative transcriptional regulator